MASGWTARETLPRLEDRLPLGDAGLTVSPFCLGAVRDRDMVPLAYDAGVNFFFVSVDLHWPLYEELRQGLARLLARSPRVRDEIVVAGVSYLTQPVFAGTNFHELLTAVPELERIDVLVAGGASAADFALRRERFAVSPYVHGLGARAFGASFHERATALNTVRERAADLAFLRYNPAHPGARRDLFPMVAKGSRTLLYNFRSVLPTVSASAWRALGLDDDHWIPSPCDYYRYALTRPQLSGILGCVNTPSELDALVAALGEGPLEPEEEAYLEQLSALAEGRARVVAESA